MITNQSNSNTGAVPKEKSSKSAKQQLPRKPPPTLDTFWPTVMQEVQNTPVVDAKHQALPLARIKKIMKLDENAKMIAAEAPLLFAKACEFFIQELTMRAWTHTDESKRRTLQRSDIAQAIANYDQFDFLIDIVPREDIKPSSHRKNYSHFTNASNNATSNSGTSSTGSATNASTQDVLHVSADSVAALPQVTNQQASGSVNVATPNNTQTATQVLTTSNPTQQLQIIQQTSQPQQLQYFITLPGQQQGQAQLQLHQLQLQQQQQLPNTIATPLTTTNLNLVAQQPQQLILTATNPNNQGSNITQQQQQAAMIQNLVQQQQQQSAQTQQPQIQLFQQVVVSPTGEIANMPIAINANQLNLLRLQMQQQHQQQHQQTQQTQQVTHQPTQQQVIIPSNCQLLTAQQLLQLQQNHANSTNNSGSTATIVHHPQPTQHHTSSQPTTNTIYINAGNATSTPATVQTSLVSADRNLANAYRNNC